MSDQLLPTNDFDRLLSRLIGLPNGAHTQPSVIQAVNFYGKSTAYMVQTVKTDEGTTIFLTQVRDDNSADRFILPPAVLKLIDRQRDSVSTQIRRRNGKRIAAEREAAGTSVGFTPEMRAKALATRRAHRPNGAGR